MVAGATDPCAYPTTAGATAGAVLVVLRVVMAGSAGGREWGGCWGDIVGVQGRVGATVVVVARASPTAW